MAQLFRHQLGRSTWAWIVYDIGNTLFQFIVLTAVFGPWLTDGFGAADSAITLTQSLTMVVVVILAPILGSLTDKTRRVPFLLVSTLVAVMGTMMLGSGQVLGLSPERTIMVAVLFYAVTNLGFQLSLVFYDALLPTVSTPKTVGRVGGTGIGIGYLGTGIGVVLIATVFRLEPGREPLIFVVTALLFLVFATPSMLLIREAPQPMPSLKGLIATSFRDLGSTLRKLPGDRDLLSFLGARVLYNDAINTFMFVLGIYAVAEVGIPRDGLLYVTLFSLGFIFALFSAPVWGHIVDRHGPKVALSAALGVWLLTLSIVIVQPATDWPLTVFYVAAPLSGIALAGTFTADRPYVLALAPPDRVGQYYGLYALAGRFAAIMGPLTWTFIVDVWHLGRPFAVTVLSWFILAALFVLQLVRRTKIDTGETSTTILPPPIPHAPPPDA